MNPKMMSYRIWAYGPCALVALFIVCLAYVAELPWAAYLTGLGMGYCYAGFVASWLRLCKSVLRPELRRQNQKERDDDDGAVL